MIDRTTLIQRLLTLGLNNPDMAYSVLWPKSFSRIIA